MNFNSLGLNPAIVRAVNEHGYDTPTPIQVQAIPAVLSGGDLLAGAQTGTGKTAGFVLPILQHIFLAKQRSPQKPGERVPMRALILAPTRELAAQVEESVTIYGKYAQVKSLAVFGGVSINPQKQRLIRGIDIVVATPGRLLDHVNQRSIDLSTVEVFVLDEADRMLDMGFIRDIKKIMALLPKKRQNLLYSATFSDEIKELANGLLNQPTVIEVARRNATATLISQRVMLTSQKSKRALLAHLIKQGNWFQVLVFCRTKHGANRLAELLDKDGITAMAIHGNKSQGARTRALSEFKTGTLQVLVATDIAARGIDIDQLPHVVNFDLPHVAEDYVHRIGRTGRAGATGEALSLVAPEEMDDLKAIEKLTKQTIERIEPVGFVAPTHTTQDAVERPPRTQQKPHSKPQPGGSKKPQQQRQQKQQPQQPSQKGSLQSNQGQTQKSASGSQQQDSKRSDSKRQQVKPVAPIQQKAKPTSIQNAARRRGGSVK
jgi:ATP-dependent RNA helicase RhlE